MRIYELTVILNASLDKAVLEKTLSKLEKLLGKVKEKKDLGKKVLAYPIKKQKEGLYYYFELEMDASKIKDLDHRLKTEEGVLRHLIVRDDR